MLGACTIIGKRGAVAGFTDGNIPACLLPAFAVALARALEREREEGWRERAEGAEVDRVGRETVLADNLRLLRVSEEEALILIGVSPSGVSG